MRSPAPPATDHPQLAPSHWSLNQPDPLQLEPLQELPLQELPDQLEPLHELPLHELPDQLEPLHELPLQELPDQLEPLHELPLHELPDQLLPEASRAAMDVESNGCPKMSCSPWRTTPFSDRWPSPRESSSEPLPVDHLALPGGGGGGGD